MKLNLHKIGENSYHTFCDMNSSKCYFKMMHNSLTCFTYFSVD